MAPNLMSPMDPGSRKIMHIIAQSGNAKIGNDTIAIREGRLSRLARYSARYRLLIASLFRNASMVSR